MGFSIETSTPAKAYQWYWNEKEIIKEDKDYDGSTAETLFIDKCLPKHKGSYQCIVMTELDTSLSTDIATLKIGMFTELCQTLCIKFILLSLTGLQIGGLQVDHFCFGNFDQTRLISETMPFSSTISRAE